MGTLQEQLTSVQARLNSERELGGQKDADKIATLEAQEADLTRQIMEQAQQERVQAQEEKVAAVVLPYDFNSIFEDPRANEMITELIQQYQRQAYEEHNIEITQLSANHKDVLRAADDRELQLKRQNEQLQHSLEAERQQAIIDAKEAVRMEQQVAQLLLDKQDSDSKRDAAVIAKDEADGLTRMAQREVERLNGHIDELRQQLANAPAPKAAIDIGGTGKLAQLVKESNEAKMNRGLQRWNNMLPEIVAPPVLPSLGENSGEVTEVPAEIPSVGESFRQQAEIPSGLGDIAAGTDQGVQAEQVTLESLHERVKALEAKVAA